MNHHNLPNDTLSIRPGIFLSDFPFLPVCSFCLSHETQFPDVEITSVIIGSSPPTFGFSTLNKCRARYAVLPKRPHNYHTGMMRLHH
jgi:hypothetical protein